ILERTGLHGVVILGGPIPKYGGDLRTCYVSYGRNRTHSAQHMHNGLRSVGTPKVVGLMKEYLQTAFIPAPRILQSSAADALVGAKYTIDEEDQSVATTPPTRTLRSLIPRPPTRTRTRDDSDAPAKKKRKRGSKGKEPKKKTASKAPAKKHLQPPDHGSDHREDAHEQNRHNGYEGAAGTLVQSDEEWNIARNQILLRPLRDEIREGLADIGLGGAKKKPAERKKRAGVESDAADTTPRKSRRLNPEEPQMPAADPGSATHAIPASTPTATEQTSVLPASQAPLPPAATPPPHMTPPPTQQQAHPTRSPRVSRRSARRDSRRDSPPAITHDAAAHSAAGAPDPAPCESAAAPTRRDSPAITHDAAAHSAAGAPDPAPCESAAAPARRDSPGSAPCESGIALARHDPPPLHATPPPTQQQAHPTPLPASQPPLLPAATPLALLSASQASLSPAATPPPLHAMPPPTQQPAHPTPLAVDVVIPAHAPAWLRDAVALFRTEVWGATSPRCSQRW
ncbi:hypothetical protein B0H13DRAFT_1918601, partial [Mycena leptocephala]